MSTRNIQPAQADDQFTGAFPRYSGAISAVTNGPPEDINAMPASLNADDGVLIFDGSHLRKPRPPVFTIGHSTHSIEEFIGVLRKYAIASVIDIRTIPASRRNPQFGKEALAKALEDAGISYVHLKELGGLRKPSKDSVNTGWKNTSFRGYADHMLTTTFKMGLEKLTSLAGKERVAILCAEAVPWRCHRSLVADALVARGYRVEDIFSATKSNPHILNAMAVLRGEEIIYPESETELKTRAM
jgi:hypothetical protein